MTTQIGSIVALNRNEQNQSRINFAIQQLVQRNSGQQVNASLTVSADYTAKASDFCIDVSNTCTITLPAANAAPGQIYCIKNIGSGKTVTVSSSSDIDGATTRTLTDQYQTLWVQSNGSTWNVLVEKQNLSGFLQSSNNLSDLANAGTARTNLGLGTAATKTVGTAANDVVQLDGSAKLPAVDGSQLTGISSTGRLVSGTPLVLNPCAFSTATTQAHGLGTVPHFIEWTWQCLVANIGYSVGDKIIGTPSTVIPTLVFDSTNLTIIFPSSSIAFINKTGFAQAALTPADWQLTLTPYKLS